MIHIYYHIYSVDGVSSIINEQLNLIKNTFNFKYKLNIGISIGNSNIPLFSEFESIKQYVRDIRAKGNEFITLDLIEKDKDNFGDSDYILYLHTKGASKINEFNYENLVDWRNLMQYFNIKNYSSAFKLFEKTPYNTYGVNLTTPANIDRYAYFGNFWWATSEYIKSIDLKNVDKSNRINAEFNYIQNGLNWKPYSPFNSGVNHYYETFSKEKYEK